MRRLVFRWFLVAALAGLASCGGRASKSTAPAPVALETNVETVRARHHLPALGLAVIDADSIRVAVSGVRKLGAPDRALAGDRFHLGSLTKAITATMIARLVEAGQLTWSRTLAQSFPELGDSMEPAYRGVTLEQLLEHRGGMPAFDVLEDFSVLPPFGGDAASQRRQFADWVLTRPPAVTPGAYLYSNAGYGVAGAIAEAATGKSWSQLVQDEVLGPLGVSATFGWPTDPSPAQPWGHTVEGGVLTPFDPAHGRVPTVVAPAGDMSMSLTEYGTFARLHLRALLGRPALLSAETFHRLHTPVGDYALGWQQLLFQGRLVLVHEGSAGTFAAFVLLDPDRQGAYAVVTNAVTADVESAFAELLATVVPRTSATPLRGLVARSGLASGAASIPLGASATTGAR